MARQYLEHSRAILTDKLTAYKPNRTFVDTIDRFGTHIAQTEYDLTEGYPLLTTKRLPFRIIAEELIWFLKGDDNIKHLVDNNVHIWDDNAFDHNKKKLADDGVIPMDLPKYSPETTAAKAEYIDRIKSDHEFAKKYGSLDGTYGYQWRKWKTDDGKEFDQVADVVNQLKNKPDSRRIILSAWNAPAIPKMGLPPCHVMSQFNIRTDDEGVRRLDCQMYQRSSDMFLGVPFNTASYSLMTHALANQVDDLQPGIFSHTFGSAHFYCGKGEVGQWYKTNLPELKQRVRNVKNREEYMDIAEWTRRADPTEDSSQSFDHVPAILEQLSREPKALPKIEVARKPITELTYQDFKITGYEKEKIWPTINRKMAV